MLSLPLKNEALGLCIDDEHSSFRHRPQRRERTSVLADLLLCLSLEVAGLRFLPCSGDIKCLHVLRQITAIIQRLLLFPAPSPPVPTMVRLRRQQTNDRLLADVTESLLYCFSSNKNVTALSHPGCLVGYCIPRPPNRARHISRGTADPWIEPRL